MTHVPGSLYHQATKALIAAEGGLRFCAACRKRKDADTFRTLRTKRGAIVRCGECADRHIKGRK